MKVWKSVLSMEKTFPGNLLKQHLLKVIGQKLFNGLLPFSCLMCFEQKIYHHLYNKPTFFRLCAGILNIDLQYLLQHSRR